MCFDCVIFDFNGTLFWDTPLHNRAWDLFLRVTILQFSSRKQNQVHHCHSIGIENVNFYFEYLGLSRWFDISLIVFNNGLIKSKPDPEIFLAAMQILGADPGKTVIFEDSETGIKAARAASPGKVIRVSSTGADDRAAGMETISHFGQVPREIFCRNIDGFKAVSNRE
jgi:beta-phosphoglucomutase-like phosphatase (HAD superfamily)